MTNTFLYMKLSYGAASGQLVGQAQWLGYITHIPSVVK